MKIITLLCIVTCFVSHVTALDQIDHKEFGEPIDQSEIIAIHFHGYGDTAADQRGLAQVLANSIDQPITVLAMQAPYTVDGGAASWFPRDGSSGDDILNTSRQFVRDIRTQHPDHTLIVGGFSQGAALTSALIANNPKPAKTVHVDGAYIWGGFLYTPPNQTWPQTARIFIFHGEQDDVAPIAPMEEWHRQLRSHKIQAEFYPEPNVGHTVTRTAVAETGRFISSIHGAKP